MENNKVILKYRTEEELLNAIDYTKKRGVEVEEVLVPYPSHDIINAMEHKTYIIHAAFVYGVIAVALIFGFLFYTSVYDWPLNIGGKPSASLPSFTTLSIVVTILFVTITSMVTFTIRAKIYPGKKEDYPNLGGTEDQFVMIIDRGKNASHEKEIERMLESWPEVDASDNLRER